MRADRPAARQWRTDPDGWLLAIAGVAAFVLRVWPFITRVITAEWVLPAGDADVFHHLRRIVLATQVWPRVPGFDAWMDFPRGAYSPWSPLFDFIPATFARASGVDPVLAGVFWPPLL